MWATFLSPITAIVAIVTGHKGKSEIRNSQGAITGKKLANAGLIMGYIYWGLIVLGIILVIALGAAFYGDKEQARLEYNKECFCCSSKFQLRTWLANSQVFYSLVIRYVSMNESSNQ